MRFETDRVEEVFNAGVDLIFTSAPAKERKSLKQNTSERLNNASSFKVDLLYFSLGIPWVMSSTKLHWQKCSNASVRATLNAIIESRNSIAHGGDLRVRKTKANRWRDFANLFPKKFDEVIADYIEQRTGTRPW